MPSHKNRNTKDSSEKNEKLSRKDAIGQRSRPASHLQRRRKGRADDDDDSVDSKGNIHDLIVSTEDEDLDDSSSFEDDTSLSEEIAPVSAIARRLNKKTPRKAAEKARERINQRLAKKKKLTKSSSRDSKDREDSEEEEEPKKKSKSASRKKKEVEESEEEEEEDD